MFEIGVNDTSLREKRFIFLPVVPVRLALNRIFDSVGRQPTTRWQNVQQAHVVKTKEQSATQANGKYGTENKQ